MMLKEKHPVDLKRKSIYVSCLVAFIKQTQQWQIVTENLFLAEAF